MRRTVMTIVAGLALAGPTLAAEQPAPDAANAAADKASGKKVCRSENVPASLMKKRTCHTEAEWRALAALEQHKLDGVQGALTNR